MPEVQPVAPQDVEMRGTVPVTASGDDCRDVCHCRPMCMPYMIKQTDAVDDGGARVLELMGEMSDPRRSVTETDAGLPVAHRRA